jgi:hypothetical protein
MKELWASSTASPGSTWGRCFGESLLLQWWRLLPLRTALFLLCSPNHLLSQRHWKPQSFQGMEMQRRFQGIQKRSELQKSQRPQRLQRPQRPQSFLPGRKPLELRRVPRRPPCRRDLQAETPRAWPLPHNPQPPRNPQPPHTPRMRQLLAQPWKET